MNVGDLYEFFSFISIFLLEVATLIFTTIQTFTYNSYTSLSPEHKKLFKTILESSDCLLFVVILSQLLFVIGSRHKKSNFIDVFLTSLFLFLLVSAKAVIFHFGFGFTLYEILVSLFVGFGIRHDDDWELEQFISFLVQRDFGRMYL